MIDLIKKNELLQNFKLLTNYIEAIPAFTSCLDCKEWAHEGDKCKKFDMKPPATTIVNKCPEFDLDIPF